MSSKIQFIVSTGSTSKEVKKAQRSIVRSHVTAQRYQKKRREEVQAYRLKNPDSVGISPRIPPESTVVAILTTSESEENGSSVSRSTSQTGTNIDSDPGSLTVAVKSPTSQLQRDFEDASFSRMYELGPEQHGGLWLPFPYSFPTLGSPYDDPFVTIPAALSPRISKHLFYCMYEWPLRTKKWMNSYYMCRCQCVNAANAPKLHDEFRPKEVSLLIFSRG
jgi:hypothetical protein